MSQSSEKPAWNIAYWSIAAMSVTACVYLATAVCSVRDLIEKQNELTSQQIAVTRSQHHVQELATAYMENRRASQAAEDAGIPVDEQKAESVRSLFIQTPGRDD